MQEQAPLLVSLRAPGAAPQRLAALGRGAAVQDAALKSSGGWVRVALTPRGRALRPVLLPWLLVTLLTTGWTCAAHFVDELRTKTPVDGLLQVYLPLATTMGFLLVFRLNRAATRYWDARAFWGRIVENARTLCGAACVHLAHDPAARDDVVRWGCLAFAVASKHFLRRERGIDRASLAGVIGGGEVEEMASAAHPPLWAAERARRAGACGLAVHADTPAGVGAQRAAALAAISAKIDALVGQVGGMERIRGTPLPLVYVAHLRAFLLVLLVALGPLWEQYLGWGTIPAVSLVAAAFLGIDAAAVECEAPFSAGSINHLNQDGACMLILSNVEQTLALAAAGAVGNCASVA